MLNKRRLSVIACAAAVLTAAAACSSKKNSSNIIKVIPKNGKVTILENCADNWFKVDYKGTVGYIKGGHFK